jgi:hypothetical protein
MLPVPSVVRFIVDSSWRFFDLCDFIGLNVCLPRPPMMRLNMLAKRAGV